MQETHQGCLADSIPPQDKLAKQACAKKKSTTKVVLFFLAEKEGFE